MSLGSNCGAEILRDGGVDDGNAVQEPGGLVAAAHVEHVVRDVGAGDVVGDHGQAVGAVGAGSALDVEAADEGGGSGGVGGDDRGRGGDDDFFIRRGHLQLKVNDRHSSRDDGDILCSLREALTGDADGILAERHGVELEFAGGVGGDALRPLRRFRFEHHHGVLNRTMLRIVHDAADRAVNIGERGGGDQQQDDKCEQLEASHVFRSLGDVECSCRRSLSARTSACRVPSRAAKPSAFVSGHRLSDAANSAKSDAPSGAGNARTPAELARAADFPSLREG